MINFPLVLRTQIVGSKAIEKIVRFSHTSISCIKIRKWIWMIFSSSNEFFLSMKVEIFNRTIQNKIANKYLFYSFSDWWPSLSFSILESFHSESLDWTLLQDLHNNLDFMRELSYKSSSQNQHCIMGWYNFTQNCIFVYMTQWNMDRKNICVWFALKRSLSIKLTV